MNNKLLLFGKFQALLKLSKEMEKSPRLFGTEDHLSHAEIHLIEAIGDTPVDMSVTDLSKAMGVTKGAVSQTLKKLEQKNYVTKNQDPDNLSRMIIGLSAKGNTAYWAHRRWHEEMDGGLEKYINDLSPEQFDIILDFMSCVETAFKQSLKMNK